MSLRTHSAQVLHANTSIDLLFVTFIYLTGRVLFVLSFCALPLAWRWRTLGIKAAKEKHTCLVLLSGNNAIAKSKVAITKSVDDVRTYIYYILTLVRAIIFQDQCQNDTFQTEMYDLAVDVGRLKVIWTISKIHQTIRCGDRCVGFSLTIFEHDRSGGWVSESPVNKLLAYNYHKEMSTNWRGSFGTIAAHHHQFLR